MESSGLPKKIDRYEIRGQLGKGAMGTILLGYDPKLEREVAIKTISSAIAKNPRALERFSREARAIAAFRHPNIVEIYDFSSGEAGEAYLVMERLKGIDLFDLLNVRGTIPEPIVAAVGKEVASALETAHQAGIIHRDLKPENIYIDNDGRVVLTDFGIAKIFDYENQNAADLAKKTEVLGTPGFMAPEQMSGKALGPGSDIFAFGVMLYNLLTRTMPFNARSPLDLYKAIIAQRYKDPRKISPLVTSQMAELIKSCLKINPEERPASGKVLVELLEEILNIWAVKDVREDIRNYLTKPEEYELEYKKRAARRERKQLKRALEHNRADLVSQIRARLAILDPNGEDSIPVLELMTMGQGEEKNVPATQLVTRRLKEKSDSNKAAKDIGKNRDKIMRIGAWSAVFTAVVFVGIMAVISLQSGPDVVPGETSILQREPASGNVLLEIQISRKAKIMLDNRLLGQDMWLTTVDLKPKSRHVLSVNYDEGKAQTIPFDVPASGRGRIYVNYPLRTFNIKWF